MKDLRGAGQGWGQGGCEPRIEVIVKFEEKKLRGGSGWGLWVMWGM